MGDDDSPLGRGDATVSPAVGIYVNNRAAVFGGDRFGLDDLLSLARRAEECGFAFVSVGDSVLAKPAGRQSSRSRPWPRPLTPSGWPPASCNRICAIR